jgi:hypothetical protein
MRYEALNSVSSALVWSHSMQIWASEYKFRTFWGATLRFAAQQDLELPGAQKHISYCPVLRLSAASFTTLLKQCAFSVSAVNDSSPRLKIPHGTTTLKLWSSKLVKYGDGMTSSGLATQPVSSVRKFLHSKPPTRPLYVMLECRPSL